MCMYFIMNTIGKLISMSISTYGFCVFLHMRILSSPHALMLCTGSPVSASREQVDSATVQSRINA